MAKKIRVVRVTVEIELTYDPQSPEFQQALSDYNECIQKDTTEEELIQHAASHVVKYGTGLMEGVGEIGEDGISLSNPELYSGITVIDSTPPMDTEIVDYHG